jgi:hypothetical protein
VVGGGKRIADGTKAQHIGKIYELCSDKSNCQMTIEWGTVLPRPF